MCVVYLGYLLRSWTKLQLRNNKITLMHEEMNCLFLPIIFSLISLNSDCFIMNIYDHTNQKGREFENSKVFSVARKKEKKLHFSS